MFLSQALELKCEKKMKTAWKRVKKSVIHTFTKKGQHKEKAQNANCSQAAHTGSNLQPRASSNNHDIMSDLLNACSQRVFQMNVNELLARAFFLFLCFIFLQAVLHGIAILVVFILVAGVLLIMGHAAGSSMPMWR